MEKLAKEDSRTPACHHTDTHSCALACSLSQVLFRDDKFQWARLHNLIQLAKEGTGDGLDLSDTVSDGARMVLLDPRLRQQLIMALTEDNRLHIQVCLKI